MAVQGYTSPYKIPKKLDFTIPEGKEFSSADEAFTFYQNRGLINPEYPNLKSWLNDVKNVANKNEWSIQVAANRLTADWRLKSGDITEIEFKRFLKAPPNSVGPLKYGGIPIRYERYKPKNLPSNLTPWKNKKLPYRIVDFSKRAFQERIPLEIQDYFNDLEQKGIIPEGSLRKFRSWIYKGNKLNDERAAMFSRRVGILKHFDKGHISALMNSTLTGGSNDPISQLVQLANENRSIGNQNLIPEHISRAADLPTNWGESAAYWLADQKGSTGTGLPLNSLLDSDKALLTRAGANPDRVVAQVYDRLDNLAQDIEATRVSNLGESESLALINKRFQNQRYVAPTIQEGLEKATSAATKNQALLSLSRGGERLWSGVKEFATNPKRLLQTGITGAAVKSTIQGGAGLAADVIPSEERVKEFREKGLTTETASNYGKDILSRTPSLVASYKAAKYFLPKLATKYPGVVSAFGTGGPKLALLAVGSELDDAFTGGQIKGTIGKIMQEARIPVVGKYYNHQSKQAAQDNLKAAEEAGSPGGNLGSFAMPF